MQTLRSSIVSQDIQQQHPMVATSQPHRTKTKWDIISFNFTFLLHRQRKAKLVYRCRKMKISPQCASPTPLNSRPGERFSSWRQMNVFGRDAASPSSASVYIRQWEMFPKIILFDAYNLLSVMNFNKFVSFDIKFKRVTNTETGTRFSLDWSWGGQCQIKIRIFPAKKEE